MSRPFSYNDENFTVIGNVLFCHILYEKAAPSGTKIIEIPPAICNRLLTFSTIGIASYNSKRSNSGNVTLSVGDEGGKCYLITASNISVGTGRFLYAWFVLKDI